jgi:hypothetical protein
MDRYKWRWHKRSNRNRSKWSYSIVERCIRKCIANSSNNKQSNNRSPGYYNFTVDPGTYIVMVMAPTGTTISPNGPVNPTTGNTASNHSDKWKYKYYN